MVFFKSVSHEVLQAVLVEREKLGPLALSNEFDRIGMLNKLSTAVIRLSENTRCGDDQQLLRELLQLAAAATAWAEQITEQSSCPMQSPTELPSPSPRLSLPATR